MKTKLIYVFVVCAIIVFIASVNLKSNRSAIADIALANIEALASGEEGVRTARCGIKLEPSSDDAFHYKCNSSTTTSLMYKCPSSVSKGEINSFEGHFSCIL